MTAVKMQVLLQNNIEAQLSQSKMQEASHIERRVEVLQSAKREMATKIAQLNEAKVIREQLEHKLFQLNANIKQLKSKQYEIHQHAVDSKCQRLQLAKKQEDCEEEIKLGIAVSQQIQMDITRHQQQIKEMEARKKTALKIKQQIDAKIQAKTAQIKIDRKCLDEAHIKQNSLKNMEQNREKMVNKIHESLQYYQHKVEQLHSSTMALQKLKQEEQSRAIQLQTAIFRQVEQIKSIEIIKAAKQREITSEQQRIDSQRLKKKVQAEKLEIMKQRLAQLQETNLYSRQLLQIKQTTAKQLQQQRNNKQSAWLSIRDKIGIELQYAAYHCNRLRY